MREGDAHSFCADCTSEKHLFNASVSLSLSGFLTLKSAWPAGVSNKTSIAPEDDAARARSEPKRRSVC